MTTQLIDDFQITNLEINQLCLKEFERLDKKLNKAQQLATLFEMAMIDFEV